MPFPKKPNALKLLQGSRQPLDPPGIDLPLAVGVPSPPNWLVNPQAVREWQRLAPTLVAHGLLSEAALSTFAVLCATFGVIAEETEAGRAPTAAVIGQYRTLANDFGLTALGAQRIRQRAQASAASNHFARLRDETED